MESVWDFRIHSHYSQIHLKTYHPEATTLQFDPPDFTKFSKSYGTFNDLVHPNLMDLPLENLNSYDIVDGVPRSPSMSLHEEMKQSLDSGPSIDNFTDMFLQDVLGSTSKVKCIALTSQLAAEEGTSSQISSNTSPNLSTYEEIHYDSSPTPDVILTRSSSCNVSVALNGIFLHHV